MINSVFLHHAVQAGLDAAIVHAGRILPLNRIPDRQRELARRRGGAPEPAYVVRAAMPQERVTPIASTAAIQDIHASIDRQHQDAYAEKSDIFVPGVELGALTRDELRKAIVLREILGPPVALKGEQDLPPGLA